VTLLVPTESTRGMLVRQPTTAARRARVAFDIRVQRALNRFGYEIRRCQPVPLLRTERVGLVLDVGANVGQYARRLRHGGYTGRIVSFEPLSGPYLELSRRSASDPSWSAYRMALAATAGSAEINVAVKPSRSSLLEVDQHHAESTPESAYVGTETVPTARLDELWDDVVGDADRVFLKIDVQGFEMQVLRGAEAVLDRLHGIQVELSLVPLYIGAPSWREVVDWLEERDFELAGIEPAFVERGRLLQVDGVFLRRR
jgi:FkbM family methyltransferase